MRPGGTTASRDGGFARVGGIDIHYSEAGAGEALVLLNQGMVSSSAVWEGDPTAYASFVDAFAERFRVIVPDPRGSGKTANDGSPVGYDQLADDVACLAEALELERPLICGFSDGGMTATVLGIRHPDVAGAIVNHAGYDLLNPSAPSIGMARQMLGGSPDATEPSLDAIAAISKQVPQLAQMFARMERDHDAAQGPGHWKAVLAQTFPRISRPSDYGFEDLAKIEAPMLVLVGDRDHFCSVEEGARALRSLTKGELAVLPATGHLITPLAVQVAIEFFDRQLAAQAS
jgi:pimeloyl-ACP methyl ester carboxylesterase